MDLTIYWTRFAENKLDDIFDYYKTKSCKNEKHKISSFIYNFPTFFINRNLKDHEHNQLNEIISSFNNCNFN